MEAALYNTTLLTYRVIHLEGFPCLLSLIVLFFLSLSMKEFETRMNNLCGNGCGDRWTEKYWRLKQHPRQTVKCSLSGQGPRTEH